MTVVRPETIIRRRRGGFRLALKIPASRRPSSRSSKSLLKNHGAGLKNHGAGMAAVDLFVVATSDALYALIVLDHDRRRLLSFGDTSHATAESIARQITEAFQWDQAPRHPVQGRDAANGRSVRQRLRAMGIRDRPVAPRSPWQIAYAERLIDSVRRERLDHMIGFSERYPRRILKAYRPYYNEIRTHLSLDKDAAMGRPIQRSGGIVALPALGGLHHQHCRV